MQDFWCFISGVAVDILAVTTIVEMEDEEKSHFVGSMRTNRRRPMVMES